MNLEAALREADARIQAQIDEAFDLLLLRTRIKFRFARRSVAQKLRNDGREKKK